MRNPTRERRTSRRAQFIRTVPPVDAHWSSKGGNWEYWPQDLRLREYPAVNQ
jgi:hypothetical protein